MANTLKYMDIVDWVTTQIATGALLPKDKFLSEAALGERFDCSRQTVRRALEVLARRGHITRVQGSGTYISADQPDPGSPSAGGEGPSMTVGVISTYLDDYIFPSIIRGIEGVFSTEGFAVQLTSTGNSVAGETRALQLMMARKLDGLIVEPTRSALPCANLDLYKAIARRGTPLVFIDSFYPELSNPYVALDDVKAGYVATQHLLGMGHRRIAGIFPHSHRQGHLRYLGYVKALSEHGIPILDERVLWYSKETMPRLLHGDQLWDHLAACTAVLCFNDATAVTVVEALRERDRSVPEDLSVVGIDDSILARSHSLTSVAHPSDQLGESAARLLLSMIRRSEGSTILFPPRLVVRGSVRKLEASS